jgi:PAP2 superfamily
MARRLLTSVFGLTLVVAAATVSTADRAAAIPGSDAVITWNANAGEAALAACIAPTGNPLHESRMYAMMHVAIHDALNAIDRRSQPYAFDDTVDPGTSADAAVAAAARDVLVSAIGEIPAPFPPACIEAGLARVEADYLVALAAIPDGQAKSDGIEVGQAAAAAIIALRTGDGSDTPLIVTTFEEGDEPGEYRFTPGTPFVFAPGWGEVTPFALSDGSQFRPSKPYKLTTHKYAEDLNEVQRLGGDDVITPSARTDEQTEMALFWIESSPLLWNRVTRSISTAEGLDLWENARLFGLLNIGLADGYVATFNAKYDYLFWRPVTAIRLADTDDNPATTVDPTWTPLVGNPPIPDYPSGHATEGGVAAQVLKRFFNTDRISFSVCSFTLPVGERCIDETPTLHHFTSFSQAMDENAVSRIYVGFHFRDAAETGVDHGNKIGNWVASHFMRPVGG